MADSNAIGVDKLNSMMRSIRFAMFTTEQNDGVLRARPMALVQPLERGEVLFLTGRDAPKVDEVREHAQVNVTFADPRAGSFISLSGKARIVDDRAAIERLWSPLYQAWFPQGLEDPRLAMIRVQVQTAEYWDRTSNRMVALETMAKAAAAGEPIQPAAAHEKVDIDPHARVAPQMRRNPTIMQPLDEETD